MSKPNSYSMLLIVLAVVSGIAGLAVSNWVHNPKKNSPQQANAKTPVTTSQDNKTKQVPKAPAEMSLIQQIKAGKKPRRPGFSLQDINGKLRNIKEWDNKVILLNFWATWCPPCKREMPAFMELQEKYGKQGLQIIGVAIDKKETVKEFADDLGINYVILTGELDAVEISKRYWNFRGQLPYTIIINRKQQIVGVKRGEISKQETERAILPLLKL